MQECCGLLGGSSEDSLLVGWILEDRRRSVLLNGGGHGRSRRGLCCCRSGRAWAGLDFGLVISSSAGVLESSNAHNVGRASQAFVE